ncbi:hypothetical protein LEMLEM_LOCUS24684 [Lemmus lemmus]
MVVVLDSKVGKQRSRMEKAESAHSHRGKGGAVAVMGVHFQAGGQGAPWSTKKARRKLPGNRGPETTRKTKFLDGIAGLCDLYVQIQLRTQGRVDLEQIQQQSLQPDKVTCDEKQRPPCRGNQVQVPLSI